MRSRFRSVVPLSFLVSAVTAATVLSAAPAWPQASAEPADAASALPQNATPAFLADSRDLGPADPHSLMTVSLHLRTRSPLDQTLQRLYDPASPQYRQWLSTGQVAALAAAPADVSTVHQFLAAHHLKWIDSAPARIVAQGTVADIQAAFQVALHRFDVHGTVVRANTSSPSISGPAAAVITSVDGLAEHHLQPHLAVATDADGVPFARVPLSLAPHGLLFSSECFRAPERVTFTSAAATATYFGNRYGQNIDNTAFGTLPPCGYQPSDVRTAYGLTPLYKAGLDGTGETIAIVDAFGSTTIQTDAAVFSEVYNLPPIDLTVIGTPTAAPYSTDANLAGWATETSLDVEWAHAIAPGAKIVLVVSPDDTDVNLAAAVATAAQLSDVVVISDSYGGPESQEDAAGFTAFEASNKLAAARGISVDYSSGDSGDFAAAIGYTDVSYPASSPWATAVGGVSVGLSPNGSISMQTGWGANITKIAENLKAANAPTVPPLNEGFLYGAGGGPSAVFAKPSFQRQLHGRTRLVPDIAWIGDPYTGVEVLVSADDSGESFEIGVLGGTSVASPMFSGLWAIAVQRAGHNLGQAARILYGLSPRAITDVRPAFSLTNPFGVIQTTSPRQLKVATASALAEPLDGNRLFYSALYDSPVSTRWFVLTFGTDSSLRIGPGWDEVTGLGTPNGATFVEEAARE